MAATIQIDQYVPSQPKGLHGEMLQQANTHGVEPEQRFAFLTKLRQLVFTNQAISEQELSNLVQLTHHLCDWQILIDLDKRFCIENPADKQLIAYAYWKLGYWMHACHLLEQLMFKHPSCTQAFHLYDQLTYQAQVQKVPRYFNDAICAELSLEPLTTHHSAEFLWQYWDPEIAQLCCLPELHSEFEWLNWFQEQLGFDDQTLQAIYHSEYGFVGVVSLVMHEQTGFIYYWVGRDFQGRGIGSNAAQLMLQMAVDIFGLTDCYAKVFESNTASQKLLVKLGFERLSVNAAPPFESEALYYLGEQTCEKDKVFALAELFEKMGSSTQVDMPLSWQLEFNYVSQL